MQSFGSYPRTHIRKRRKIIICVPGSHHTPSGSRTASRPRRRCARWDCPNSNRAVWKRTSGDSIPLSLGRNPMPNLHVVFRVRTPHECPRIEHRSASIRWSELTLKDRLPVVRRETLAIDVSRGTPDIPIALGIIFGRFGALEPWVLCRTYEIRSDAL